MSMEAPDRFTGGYLCGSVRIVASGRPYRVGVCHCLDCRKHHGALFHASAIFNLWISCEFTSRFRLRNQGIPQTAPGTT